MIIVRWFNVYLTLDGFQLGDPFEFAHQAELQNDEHPDFIETIIVPVEVKREEIQRVNR